jgi:hypothetical protein
MTPAEAHEAAAEILKRLRPATELLAGIGGTEIAVRNTLPAEVLHALADLRGDEVRASPHTRDDGESGEILLLTAVMYGTDLWLQTFVPTPATTAQEEPCPSSP